PYSGDVSHRLRVADDQGVADLTPGTKIFHKASSPDPNVPKRQREVWAAGSPGFRQLRREQPFAPRHRLVRRPAMNEPSAKARDYSETLFLPKTDFPMRAGLPQREPEILARWKSLNLYGRLRAAAKGRVKFVLHDGPPYANGNVHIGTALNKILKDVVTRSQQMLGFDSNYV